MTPFARSTAWQLRVILLGLWATGFSSPVRADPPKALASSIQLAKVVDFSKLPQIAKSKVGRNESANFTADVPGSVADVAKHYRTQLDSLGWKPATNAAKSDDSESCASSELWKDGHSLYLMVFRFGDKPSANVTLGFRGNLDTRTLPRSKGAKELYGSQIQTTYVAEAKVPAEAETLAKDLTADGWQEFKTLFTSTTKSDKERHLQFRKNGYAITVSVEQVEAQNNKTVVQYGVEALSHELPAPADATDVEFADLRWEMRCKVARDLKAVAEFYEKAMPAAGYTALQSEKPTATGGVYKYATPEKDVISVILSSKDGKATTVKLIGFSQKGLEDRKKAIERGEIDPNSD
ncbi:hypothetical protein [Limnoglobus roseus]|uniref:Uncharacterized protein n=1 Tax=Limnoglobus roseus TaxID=2598579 RepID=A0A5C1ACE8_9BACT|nr:hypothetical protein [Limnoglobus roseus]QEL17069.1 hypothetical protein PX52LOC_04045 [Limnoglobus roseus]